MTPDRPDAEAVAGFRAGAERGLVVSMHQSGGEPSPGWEAVRNAGLFSPLQHADQRRARSRPARRLAEDAPRSGRHLHHHPGERTGPGTRHTHHRIPAEPGRGTLPGHRHRHRRTRHGPHHRPDRPGPPAQPGPRPPPADDRHVRQQHHPSPADRHWPGPRSKERRHWAWQTRWAGSRRACRPTRSPSTPGHSTCDRHTTRSPRSCTPTSPTSKP